MKLSIIIITYNADRYIADCLNSVLSSIVRFNDYEIIIFDNNSNDNTIMYIEDFLSAKIKIPKIKNNIIPLSTSQYILHINLVNFMHF